MRDQSWRAGTSNAHVRSETIGRTTPPLWHVGTPVIVCTPDRGRDARPGRTRVPHEHSATQSTVRALRACSWRSWAATRSLLTCSNVAFTAVWLALYWAGVIAATAVVA